MSGYRGFFPRAKLRGIPGFNKLQLTPHCPVDQDLCRQEIRVNPPFLLALSYISEYSEITERKEIMPELSSVQKKYILHWGEMGTRWGVSRTVAQIHALLYIWPEPLNAEEITVVLSVARSNVSMSIKELQGWGLVKVTHVIGNRKDHFETLTDVWEMFRIVLEERKRREVDPTFAMLEECLAEMKKTRDSDKYTKERLLEMQDFFKTAIKCYEQTRGLSTSSFRKLAGMGGWVLKALKLG